MLVKSWILRIGGEENNYRVHLEAVGEAESIDQVREALRGLLGNIRLTTAEVVTELDAGREFEARSLPVASPGNFEQPLDDIPHAGTAHDGTVRTDSVQPH